MLDMKRREDQATGAAAVEGLISLLETPHRRNVRAVEHHLDLRVESLVIPHVLQN